MSPILTLEAEIRAAVKTAGDQMGPLDLLGEIRAGIKLAGEAVVPPVAAPAAAAPKPAPAPAPQGGAKGFMERVVGPLPPKAPGLKLNPAPAQAAPGKPTTAPAPAAAAQPAAAPPPAAQEPKPAETPSGPQPYKVPDNRPQAPQGALSSGWDAVKNNWDVAAIPLSMLAMMFGGKAGKMLGALGMAAGSYGLYNRYQNMQNYGEALPRVGGETDAQYQARQAEQTVKNMQGGRQASLARRQAETQFKGPMEAAEKQFQDLLAAQPDMAAKVQPVIEAKNAMWEAKTAYNDVLKNSPQDAAGLASAKAASDQAEQAYTALQADPATKQAMAPFLQAREAADAAKWKYQNAMKSWTEWEKKNPQLGGSFKAVHSLAPGVLLNQVRSANPELAGASERTINDLMYHLGHGEKPSDYSQVPMTPEENAADRALAWMLQSPEAAAAMKQGGPGALQKILVAWNDKGAGKRWE